MSYQDFLSAVHAVALKRRPVSIEGQQVSLQRKLTAVDLTLLGIGACVGAGIFIIIGAAVQPTGPAVVISFLLAALGCTFSALCYAELAARLPVSGSVYLYAYTAFGELVAVLCTLNLLVDYHVGAALAAVSTAAYLRSSFAGVADSYLPPMELIAASVLATVTASLCFGIDKGLRRVNGVLVAAKIAILVIIIAAGSGEVKWDNLQPFAPFGLAPVAAMAAMCSYSYIGFDVVACAAEECQQPNRDIPLGIISTLFICALLYAGLSLVVCGVVPYHQLDIHVPLATAFGPQHAQMPWINRLVNVGAIVAFITALLGGCYSQARIYLSVSRDGLFFPFFNSISTATGTPIRAQVLCGTLATVLAVTLPLEKLVRFLNIGVLASYSVVCAGVLVLRSTRPADTAVKAGLVSVTSVVSSVVAAHFEHFCSMVIPSLAVERYTPHVTAATVAMVALSWWPVLQGRYEVPSSFGCPLCPFVPLLGMTMNGYMLAQCHWEAWARFGVTTVMVVLIYAVKVQRQFQLLQKKVTGLSESFL